MKPVYKNHISWRPGADEAEIRNFCQENGLVHEITISQKYGIDNREVDELTTGKWTGFTEQSFAQVRYRFFFENECDTMALKLRCY